MTRYVTLPKAPVRSSDWWDEGPLLPHLTVDGERGPQDSGLVDARGEALYRLPTPLGFHHPRR